jgi:hypothetical protein
MYSRRHSPAKISELADGSVSPTLTCKVHVCVGQALSPANGSKPMKGRQGSWSRRDMLNVVPPAFGAFSPLTRTTHTNGLCALPHTTTASIRAIQWSASSCPEAKAEITSNT